MVHNDNIEYPNRRYNQVPPNNYCPNNNNYPNNNNPNNNYPQNNKYNNDPHNKCFPEDNINCPNNRQNHILPNKCLPNNNINCQNNRFNNNNNNNNNNNGPPHDRFCPDTTTYSTANDIFDSTCSDNNTEYIKPMCNQNNKYPNGPHNQCRP